MSEKVPFSYRLIRERAKRDLVSHAVLFLYKQGCNDQGWKGKFSVTIPLQPGKGRAPTRSRQDTLASRKCDIKQVGHKEWCLEAIQGIKEIFRGDTDFDVEVRALIQRIQDLHLTLVHDYLISACSLACAKPQEVVENLTIFQQALDQQWEADHEYVGPARWTFPGSGLPSAASELNSEGPRFPFTNIRITGT